MHEDRSSREGAPLADLLLAALRGEIDDLDRRLLTLLNQRARLVARIGARKRELGLPAIDRAREAAMAARHAAAPPDGLPPHDLARLLAVARRVFRRIAARGAED